jgi:NAD(P)-dependent dehydrogenase (short-subunit alcohol dehydrogenase family)
MFDMTGRSALVTGAGSGIGTMIAQAYYNQGATVYLVGRRPEKLEEAKATIEKSNTNRKGKIIVLPGDVSTRDAILKRVIAVCPHIQAFLRSHTQYCYCIYSELYGISAN